MLTVSTMADKHGNPFGKSIPVDVESQTPLNDAIKWILDDENR